MKGRAFEKLHEKKLYCASSLYTLNSPPKPYNRMLMSLTSCPSSKTAQSQLHHGVRVTIRWEAARAPVALVALAGNIFIMLPLTLTATTSPIAGNQAEYAVFYEVVDITAVLGTVSF